VHAIQSWDDLKNRLDSDRRLYAFFHPRMPMEPLIFVEVALTDRLADSIQALLDEHAPVFDARRADTAIFYSISNTQTGLRGVSFGNFLLKRVIDDLQRDFPKLRQFATLSPLPGFAAWLRKNPQELAAQGLEFDVVATRHRRLDAEAAVARRVNEALAEVAARYLTLAKAGRGDGLAAAGPGGALPPRQRRAHRAHQSARRQFAQGNAAVLRRHGELPVRPRRTGTERRNFAREGTIATSAAVRRLARPNSGKPCRPARST
jgi:malonyl-CoA decarboxylase